MSTRRLVRADRRRWSVAGQSLAPGVAVVVAAAATALAWTLLDGGSPAGPWLVGLPGLAAGDDAPIEDLTAKVRRLAAGECDVEFPTERDDALGGLADALADLAASIEARERDAGAAERSTGDDAADWEAASTTERQLEAIVQNTESAIYIKDADGVYRFVNEATADFLGLDRESIVGRDDEELFDAETAADAHADDEHVMETGESISREATRPIDGGEHVFLDNKYPYRDEDGEVIGVMGVSRDVTDRKRAERELRETKDRLERFIERAPVGVTALEADGTVTLWNDAMERIFGWSAGEVVGNQYPAVPEGKRDQFESLRNRTWSGESLSQVEVRRRTRSGQTIDVSVSTAPIYGDGGEVSEVVSFVEDVTERKERERELRETKRRLELVLEGTNTGLWEWRLETDEVIWNETMARLVGMEPGEFEGTLEAFTERVHPDDRERLRSELTAAIEADDVLNSEFRLFHESGDVIWVSVRGRVLSDDGDDRRMVGINNDVTERKAAERELREREEELREYRDYTEDILDAIDDVFYVTDEDGEVLRWNESLVETTGYSDAEIEGMHATEFFREEDRREARAGIDAALRAGKSRGQRPFVTSDGGEIPHEFVATGLTDPDGNPVVVGIGRDVTERIETERELSRLISNVPGCVYRVANDSEWSIEFVSEGVREIAGYDPETIESGEVNWIEDVELDGPDWTEIHEAAEAGEAYDLTYSIETADGEVRWIRDQGRAARGPDGTVEAVEGVVLDVTERIEYERELERTRDLLQHAQRIGGIGGWEIDLRSDPNELFWTDEVYRIHGLEPDADVDLEDGIDYYHPDDRERIREAVRRAIEEGEPYDVEARLITADGEQRWVRSIGEPAREDGGDAMIRGSIQEITRRKEREQELERSRHLLQQAQRLSAFAAWSVDLTGDGPHYFEWSEEMFELFELPDKGMTIEDVVERYHPEDREGMARAYRRAVEDGEGWDRVDRTRPPSGEQRWTRTICQPVVEDGEVVQLIGSAQDVTDQKERERTLRSLHETARDLLATESDAEVAELAVETARSVLDVASVCAYLVDEGSNRLVPAAATGAFGDDGGPPPVDVGADDAVWECFATGSPMVVDASDDEGRSVALGDGTDGGLLVPIGEHGVFVVAAGADRIDDEVRRLAGTLVATTEAALDRLASEAELRARDEELAARNERLRRQMGITDIIRRVDQSLIAAESREDVERTVCERLVESDDVAFAWIGRPDEGEQRLVPQAWAGDGEAYLDDRSLSFGSAEPASVAARTGETTVVSNVVDRLQSEDWRQGAVSNGFHSVVAVPLSVDEYSHGVLAVYAGEPDAFGDLERTVFAELGRTIANAVDAVMTRTALHADTLVELTLELDDADEFLSRVAREADCEATYEGIATHSADETRLFFATTGATGDAVAAVLADSYAVDAFRLIDESCEDDEDGERRCLFEATVTGPVLASTLVRRGVRPRSIRATPGGTEAVVDASAATDVREFVEALAETYPSVELVKRQTVERDMATRQELVSSLLDGLTDRQREVLRTAYYAGFFDWPRTSTGEDVAEMLDVTQPTVNRHLRLGQQRLLAQLFDEETGGVVAA
ncbi:PAS domain S-box protein [Halomicrobium urmianum]|uniref:PAS domain S-box protein n=1 Tax=Halomicrobium urmianum TaxID=1586233 RepID=UPI001CDA1AEE|nr:PAS domain S-box protein [Halomicrobium urmianum]